jgi:hypothetical protein
VSKIIKFPNSAAPQPEPIVTLENTVRAIATSYSTVSSALLRVGVDDLAAAVDKVAGLVNSIPPGEARERAEKQLTSIRKQLEEARALSEEVAWSTSD